MDLKSVFKTSDHWTPLILRVILGIVVLGHGLQKSLGWFGGYGFEGTMSYFTEALGLPWVIGFLVIFLESVGAIILIVGLATRLVAVAFTFLAVAIVLTSHIDFGFFMNWGGNQAGEGIEYFILWVGMSVALVISGGGRSSLDRHILA